MRILFLRIVFFGSGLNILAKTDEIDKSISSIQASKS